MKDYRVEIFKGEGIQPWYLRLVAGNNETLVISEGYYSKWNAQRAARRVFVGLPIIIVLDN